MHLTTVQPNFLVPIPTALGIGCVISFPGSRGSVAARSSNPFDRPTVVTGIYSDVSDINDMISCIMAGRGAMEADPSIASVFGAEFIPGANFATPTELAQSLLASYRFSYHAFGSNMMGSDATGSVVDQNLLVHGFANLRVVDNSVFPASISSGPMSTTYMLGWRAASIIGQANYVNDLNAGYLVCSGGSALSLGVSPDDPTFSGAALCAALGKTVFQLNDPTTCNGQLAASLLSACDTPYAMIVSSSGSCGVLESVSGIIPNTPCEGLPVICGNIFWN